MKNSVVYTILGVVAAGLVGTTVFMSGSIMSNMQNSDTLTVVSHDNAEMANTESVAYTTSTDVNNVFEDTTAYLADTTADSTENTTGTVAAEHDVTVDPNTKEPIGTEIDTSGISDEVKSNLKVIDRSKQETVYVIQEGDTLSYISGQLGYSVDELASYNKIEDKNLIYSNSALRLPQHSVSE